MASTNDAIQDRLVELIEAAIPDAESERKWGRLTFTREANWHHWICALAPSKTHVKLVLHKGVKSSARGGELKLLR